MGVFTILYVLMTEVDRIFRNFYGSEDSQRCLTHRASETDRNGECGDFGSNVI